jgi:hypothetical protein
MLSEITPPTVTDQSAPEYAFRCTNTYVIVLGVISRIFRSSHCALDQSENQRGRVFNSEPHQGNIPHIPHQFGGNRGVSDDKNNPHRDSDHI